jgi:hypothetical protein
MAVPSLRKTRNKVVDSASAGAAGASHSDAANAMQVRLCIEDFRVMGRTKRVKRVENLLMNGEFPVEYTTTEFFFHRIGRESSRSGCCDRPSYFVSLVSQCALRRILAAPRFNFLHSYTVVRHCLERTIAGRPFVIEVTWVAEKTLARPYREDSGRPHGDDAVLW